LARLDYALGRRTGTLMQQPADAHDDKQQPHEELPGPLRLPAVH